MVSTWKMRRINDLGLVNFRSTTELMSVNCWKSSCWANICSCHVPQRWSRHLTGRGKISDPTLVQLCFNKCFTSQNDIYNMRIILIIHIYRFLLKIYGIYPTKSHQGTDHWKFHVITGMKPLGHLLKPKFVDLLHTKHPPIKFPVWPGAAKRLWIFFLWLQVREYNHEMTQIQEF